MNNVLLWLTKRYLRLTGSRFVRLDVITLPGEETQEVIIYSDDKPLLLGQVTFFHTTIIHESVISTEQLLNYIVIHETGHKKQWYSYFIYPLIIVCVLAFFFLLIGAILSLLTSLIYLNISYLYGGLLCLISSILSLAILGFFSWFLEINAEFYAISKLGMQGYQDARLYLPKRTKRSFYIRAIIFLTHPPNSIVLRVYKWMHKKSQE